MSVVGTAGISAPKSGAALAAPGATFQQDLHTSTGNLTVPILLPAGRCNLTPLLFLAYRTGAGNGPFGLGWTLNVPVSRRTDRRIPRYDDTAYTFMPSGAEELVPVPADGSVLAGRATIRLSGSILLTPVRVMLNHGASTRTPPTDSGGSQPPGVAPARWNPLTATSRTGGWTLSFDARANPLFQQSLLDDVLLGHQLDRASTAWPSRAATPTARQRRNQ
jgi:hypothetical protein